MSQFWDNRYSSNPEGFGTEPSRFLVEVADRISPASRIYLPGDGYGRNGLWLSRQGHSVTIVDHSQVAIKLANENASRYELEIEAIYDDVLTYDARDYDAVVSIYVHVPCELREATHRKMWKALKPGGIFILEGFTPKQRLNNRTSGGPADLDRLFTPEMLRNDFPEAIFEILEEKTIEKGEGEFHSGLADIIQMLATKPGTN